MLRPSSSITTPPFAQNKSASIRPSRRILRR
jgi:hypothetical protein